MNERHASIVRAVEAVEAMAEGAAFGGAEARLEELERALEQYLEPGHVNVGCEATTELLWRMFSQLAGAVEARDARAVAAAASDLKRDLELHSGVHQAHDAAA